MTEFSLKMNQQEIALPVKITLTSKNLKRQIEENALEFQNEVTKLNKCLDKKDKKTWNLINQPYLKTTRDGKNASSSLKTW